MRLLPYSLRGKYDGCSRTRYGVSMMLLPHSLRGKYDVAPIFIWGKYGCSSTCYWVEGMIREGMELGHRVIRSGGFGNPM
ncbi:hypothetical protein E3N88_18020 [Mikania micrantha]|uniref:Uncharacterized protein n=1 Tax=Mikania micrantha TaxID=192012 RepID=A0A5N6NU24_9ASTR|nr:hypothetical protein E3N88_18020 [Mikania micrantha]